MIRQNSPDGEKDKFYTELNVCVSEIHLRTRNIYIYVCLDYASSSISLSEV